MVYYYTSQYDDYMMHHGIKNQKWGIRRFQNEDGSLTETGIKRYRNTSEQKSLKRRLNDLDKDRARSLADYMVADRKASKKEKKLDRLRNKGINEESKKFLNAKSKSSKIRDIADKDLNRMRDDERQIDESVKEAMNKGYLVTGNDRLRERKRDVAAAIAGGELIGGTYGAVIGRGADRIANLMKYKNNYGYDYKAKSNGRDVTGTFKQTPDMTIGRSYKVNKLADGTEGEYIQNRTIGENVFDRRKRVKSGEKYDGSYHVQGYRR